MAELSREAPRPDSWADLALAHRLTLVVAAPGWGKSTLLRGLVAEAPSVEVTRPPSGWTPFSLARQLLDALVPKVPALSGHELPLAAAPDTPDNPDQTGALAAGVCAAAATAVTTDRLVIIDDGDVVPGDPLEQFLEALVLHLPPRLHLVLACRQPPSLRLARLRAAGEVVRITAADLAITADTVDRGELAPAARDALEEIVRATGGWPLAVQLAADVLRRTGPTGRSELIDRLLAPDAVLFEYLADEVLAGLADDELAVVNLAAHVPYVSAEVLIGLGRRDLATALERMGEHDPFLEPELASPCRRRASLLGGEFVRRAQPPPPPELLRAAVDAYLAHGDLEASLALCARLGDAALAKRVVLTVERVDRTPDTLAAALEVAESAGPDPGLAERRGDLQYLRGDWTRALESYATAAADGSGPRLARKRGVILYLQGRLDEAEATLDAAPLDSDDPANEAQVLAWRACIRWLRGDADGCATLLVPARRLAEGTGDDAALATVCTAEAMLAALLGDRRTNARVYRIALEHAERADDILQIVRIRTNRGSHHTEEGSYEAAIEELDAAIEGAELIGSDTFAGLAYANRGDTFTRMGRLDDAVRDLRRAQDIWERLGSSDVAYALAQLGDAQLLRGQRADALALHTEAISVAERAGDAQSLTGALLGLARDLLADDPAGAARAVERAIAAGPTVAAPHVQLVAGWVDLRRDDRVAAARRAEAALRLGQAHGDRPAVAEALLLQAIIDQPPSAAKAAESSRLWADLGNPIGEARALLVLAGRTPGRRGEELAERAEALLFDAGAWGPLAEARQATTDIPPIVISTLGGFRLTRHGTAVDVGDWGSRKARDLVKLLVARRGAPVVRDEVATMLWPDETDRSARRLSVLLSTIRGVFDPTKIFPPDHFVGADHDTVWLVREHVEVDVELFLTEAAEGRRLLANADIEKGGAVVEAAVARYLGDFCADDPYADWAAGIRELARHTFVESAGQLARLADLRGDHGEAVRHRLRILDVDPYDENAHLELIRSLSAQRRHGEARRAYRTYCARLGELEIDPVAFPA